VKYAQGCLPGYFRMQEGGQEIIHIPGPAFHLETLPGFLALKIPWWHLMLLLSLMYSLQTIYNHDMNLFTIYPNPVKDNFTVRFADYAKGEYTLMICSVVGKQERVLKFNINGGEHEHEVEVGDLASGIHFVLIDDKYSTYVQKLVIF
jgi:hypothetical protein